VAGRFCGECGRELPEPGALCPTCPQIDSRRRAVVNRYAGQLAEFRAIDAVEHAAQLAEQSQAAETALARAAEALPALELAETAALAGSVASAVD
jgi:hypothetical protein